MKLSLAWIFDHIQSDWKQININDLVAKINTTVAEVKSFYELNLNIKDFSIAQVKDIGKHTVILYVPEYKKEVELPLRKDLENGSLFLIKKAEKEFF